MNGDDRFVGRCRIPFDTFQGCVSACSLVRGQALRSGALNPSARSLRGRPAGRVALGAAVRRGAAGREAVGRDEPGGRVGVDLAERVDTRERRTTDVESSHAQSFSM